jgi:hypothetical protein
VLFYAASQPIEVLHTYDKELLKLSGQIGNQPLKICHPEIEEKPEPQKPLF